MWGYSGDQEEQRMPDDLVKRFRKKLKLNHSTAVIETVWGYGYRLTEKSNLKMEL